MTGPALGPSRLPDLVLRNSASEPCTHFARGAWSSKHATDVLESVFGLSCSARKLPAATSGNWPTAADERTVAD